MYCNNSEHHTASVIYQSVASLFSYITHPFLITLPHPPEVILKQINQSFIPIYPNTYL